MIFGRVPADRPPTFLEEILRARELGLGSQPPRENGRTAGLLSFSSARSDAFSKTDRPVFDTLGHAYGDVLLELALRETDPDQPEHVD